MLMFVVIQDLMWRLWNIKILALLYGMWVAKTRSVACIFVLRSVKVLEESFIIFSCSCFLC